MARGMGGRSPSNIAHHLRGIDFPVRREDLLVHANGKQADREVLEVLRQMPEREYGSMADVMTEVGEVE